MKNNLNINIKQLKFIGSALVLMFIASYASAQATVTIYNDDSSVDNSNYGFRTPDTPMTGYSTTYCDDWNNIQKQSSVVGTYEKTPQTIMYGEVNLHRCKVGGFDFKDYVFKTIPVANGDTVSIHGKDGFFKISHSGCVREYNQIQDTIKAYDSIDVPEKGLPYKKYKISALNKDVHFEDSQCYTTCENFSTPKKDYGICTWALGNWGNTIELKPSTYK